MEQERNNTEGLITSNDAKAEKLRDRATRVTSWVLSNLFSILFPVGAIFFVENFKTDGQFKLNNNYSEILMVAISICVNLIVQLNSKKYNIKESMMTLVRIVIVACIVLSSLAYGVSKTISAEQLVIDIVFKFSIGMGILAFFLGIICEIKKKGGS